ncbi:MAG: redoxin domain-containing protein, partial [Planctomycetales bacterium]|nr:redoxin domain-containing protein [Planctomycetales bacterium]
DQYRWFGIGGLRWGLDPNEDGKIDDWKWISPEEVTSELIRAIGSQDVNRFNALLATENELKKSGLSDELVASLTAQITKAKADFADYAKQQNRITEKTNWVDFSAPQPGVVPAGSQQTQQDLIVYENVIAMLETEGTHGELPVGTLVRVDNRWRLLGLPGRDEGGFFFRVADRRTLPVASIADVNNPKTQQLVQRLEELDQKLASASTPDSLAEIYSERAGVLRDLIASSEGEERDMWLLQLVDSVVATAQPGAPGDPAEILQSLSQEIEKATDNKEIIGQARFAFLTADYTQNLQKPSADLAKIQDKWIADLTEFVEHFKGAKSTGEAMLQLAISKEFAGEDAEANRWYAAIVKDHAGTDMAEKARGAARRLNSIGKPLQIKGAGIQGSTVDSAALRGNLVVVQYWATWCDPCKQDMAALRDLLARYGKKKFAVVGVNLDDDGRSALAFLQQNKLTWP